MDESQFLNKIRTDTIHRALEQLTEAGVPVLVTERYKTPRKWNGRWAMIFLEAVQHAALNKNLGNEDYRVLLYLISQLDWENWIQLTQQAIADNLAMKRQNVTRSLKKLAEHGYIDIIKRGRLNLYRLNANFVWKGPVNKLHKQRAEDRTIIPFPKKEEDYPF